MRNGRKLNEVQKKKISNAMKKFHAHRSTVQKQRTAEKQRQSMLDYWSSLPDGETGRTKRTSIPTRTAVRKPPQKTS